MDNGAGGCPHDVSFVATVPVNEVRRAAPEFLWETQERHPRKRATAEA